MAAIGVLASMSGLDEAPLEGQGPPPAMWGHPERAELDSAAPAVLTLVFAPDREVAAARVLGVVTAVTDPVEHPATGDVLYEVDGVGVYAIVSDVPPHAPVAWGDRGADVDAHGELLETLQYLDPADSAERVVDGTFLSGLQELAADLGYSDVGAAAADVFAHLVWVPRSESSPGYELQVGPGQPAPVYPSPVLVEQGAVVAASVVVSGAADREWVFENEQVSIEVGADGSVGSESLGLLNRLYDRGDEPEGTLQLRVPDQVWLVPAAAVLVGSGGTRCVISRIGSQVSALEVEISTARVPGAAVLGDLNDSEVLLNAALLDPGALVGSNPCAR